MTRCRIADTITEDNSTPGKKAPTMSTLQYRKTITRITKAVKRVYTGESRDAVATLAVIVNMFVRADKPAVPAYLQRRMVRTLAAARVTLITVR